MFCSLSGQVPQNPVVSKDGILFEQSIIRDYLKTNSTCPITHKPLNISQLIPITTSHPQHVAPRLPTSTSIPQLISTLKTEFDAMTLDYVSQQKKIDQLTEKANKAIDQRDAALMVIARLLKEKDQLEQKLIQLGKGIDISLSTESSITTKTQAKPMDSSSDDSPIFTNIQQKSLEIVNKRNELANSFKTAFKGKPSKDALTKQHMTNPINSSYKKTQSFKIHSTCPIVSGPNHTVLCGGAKHTVSILSKDGSINSFHGSNKSAITSMDLFENSLVSAAGKTINIWNFTADELTRVSSHSFSEKVVQSHIHPTSEYIFATMKNHATLWSKSEETDVVHIGPSPPSGKSSKAYHSTCFSDITASSLSPDGSTVVLGYKNSPSLQQFDLRDPRQAALNIGSIDGNIQICKHSPAGYLLLAGTETQVSVYDLRFVGDQKKSVLFTIQGSSGSSSATISAADWERQHGFVVSVGFSDGIVDFYHTAKKQMKSPPSGSPWGSFQSSKEVAFASHGVQFSLDSSYIYLANNTQVVCYSDQSLSIE